MTELRLLDQLTPDNEFLTRHNGPRESDMDTMLQTVNATSLEHLIEETVPAGIRLPEPMALEAPLSEVAMLAKLKAIAGKNQIKRSLIGQGYYGTHTPHPILRNVLENPVGTPLTPHTSQRSPKAVLNHC